MAVPSVGVLTGVRVGSGVNVCEAVGARVGGMEVATVVGADAKAERNGNCPRKPYTPLAIASNKIKPATIQPAREGEAAGAV